MLFILIIVKYIWLVGKSGDPLVPADWKELGLVQKVHDLCDLSITVVPHVLHTTAVHVVPHLKVMWHTRNGSCDTRGMGHVTHKEWVMWHIRTRSCDTHLWYLDVAGSGSSDESSAWAVQRHGSDFVLAVCVSETKDLPTSGDVPHIHLSSLTTTHNLKKQSRDTNIIVIMRVAQISKTF